MVNKCIICDKKLSGIKRKFCSRKCTDRDWYMKNKNARITYARNWERRNPEMKRESSKKSCDKFRKNEPERFALLMKQNFQRNKIKYYCRTQTSNILNGNGGYKKYNLLKKQCKCGSVDNLEIHHEEYTIGSENIKKLIDDGKIYYMCRKCHGRRGTHKFKYFVL